MRRYTESSRAWAHRITNGLHPRWTRDLLKRWERDTASHQPGDFLGSVQAERNANVKLREVVERLEVVRLPLDARDSDICQAAEELAQRCRQLETATMAGQKAGPWACTPVFGQDVPEKPLFPNATLRRFAMARIAEGYGVEPPVYRWMLEPLAKGRHVQDGPAIARMCDPLWWRRKLRAVQATQVEGAAIAMGYVNKRRDPYASNETVLRRAQQNERNAASLEATTATNEEGQEYTLAELAAKGPANKAIRRAELMTRISGFERIADDMGHVGLFFTMTCPSRMHKWRTMRNGSVQENPSYDGTLPNVAQKHLAKTWARIRAAIARRGMPVYGFRIAEPNHDGTPHWHLLVFLAPTLGGSVPRSAIPRFCAVVRRYAIADSPKERGAKQHRCDFKPIDKGRGSAAGYIAKYVAKNIDGYRLDKDLIGNDAIETSHRVEAWASTWRIRQFQQVGGPPVGPWRELRRVKDVPADAPAHLKAAHQAVNKTKALDDLSDSQQQVVKGAQWDAYCKAQGGVFCGRKYAIRVEMAERDGANKYGEALGRVPVGVNTLETYTPEHMTFDRCGKRGLSAVRRIVVESARHQWTISRAGREGCSKRGSAAPWTCVNNCTRGTKDGKPGSHEIGGREGSGRMGERPITHQSDGGGIRWPTHGSNYGHEQGNWAN